MGRTLADIWKRVTEVRGDRWLFQEEVATIEVKLFCKNVAKNRLWMKKGVTVTGRRIIQVGRVNAVEHGG